MSVVPTTGAQLVKGLQYVEEATYGTLPTSSPTFNWIGLVNSFDPNIDTDVQERKAVGSEDVQSVLLGKEQDILKITYDLQSSAFIKYAINSVNWGSPSGTVAASLSILWSLLLNGTETFNWVTGARPNTLKLKGTAGMPHSAEMEMWMQQYPTPSTSNPCTTPTFATNPATKPWNFADGGSTPVTIGGSNIHTTEIEVDFNRNPKRIHTLEQTQQLYMPPTLRSISGTITVVWSGTANMVDLTSLNEKTLVWTLKSGTSTLTLTNNSFRKLSSLQATPDDVIYEKYAFGARTASVT